jgi:hypothetical protein
MARDALEHVARLSQQPPPAGVEVAAAGDPSESMIDIGGPPLVDAPGGPPDRLEVPPLTRDQADATTGDLPGASRDPRLPRDQDALASALRSVLERPRYSEQTTNTLQTFVGQRDNGQWVRVILEQGRIIDSSVLSGYDESYYRCQAGEAAACADQAGREAGRARGARPARVVRAGDRGERGRDRRRDGGLGLHLARRARPGDAGRRSRRGHGDPGAQGGLRDPPVFRDRDARADLAPGRRQRLHQSAAAVRVGGGRRRGR